jgi:hypothetical protein
VSTPASPNTGVGSRAKSRFLNDATRGSRRSESDDGCAVCICAKPATERRFQDLHQLWELISLEMPETDVTEIEMLENSPRVEFYCATFCGHV